MAIDWPMRHKVVIHPATWDTAYEVLTRVPGQWDMRAERIVEPRRMQALVLDVSPVQRLALEASLPAGSIVAAKAPKQPRRRAASHGR